MNSKYIKILVATAFIATTYTSCDEDVLNIDPPLQSEVSYFNNAPEFRFAVVGAYANLNDYYSSGSSGAGGGAAMLQAWFLPGDDLTINQRNDFELFTPLTQHNNALDRVYRTSYIMSNRANRVLDKLKDAVSKGILTETEKNTMEGEMLFLRGFAHFMLWNVFGTAPILNSETSANAAAGLPNSKAVELLDQAIKDFDIAREKLPTTPWDASQVGRATRNAANGMLGKTLVFRGTVTNSSDDFTKAVEAFDRITGASLVPNYGDNFRQTTENNAESIFEYQAGFNAQRAGNTNPWLANDATDIGVAGFYIAMFTGHNDSNYMGGGQYRSTTKLRTAMPTSDPRRAFTLGAGDVITKYTLNSPTIEGNGAITINNYRILRYADVLLLKAEAKAQLGGATNMAEAIALINQVRTRARNTPGAVGVNLPNLNVAETSKATVMQWIMDERFVELAAEGHRWWDLRRWHLGGLITLNNAFFASALASELNFEQRHLNFPLPAQETSRNPNLVPTPGY